MTDVAREDAAALRQALEKAESRLAERSRQMELARSLLETDVRERAHFQAEVENLRYLYELILNSTDVGIYGVDRKWQSVFVNAAAARMVGWPVEELVGKSMHAISHHSHPDGSPYPLEDCPITAAIEEGAFRRVDDEVFWRRDGSAFEVEYSITPMREGGVVVGAVVMFTDISQRKRNERALQQSYAELRELNRKLAEAQSQMLQAEKLASIGQLAAGVAHEINNPIGFVSSNLASLQEYLAGLFRLLDAYSAVEPQLAGCGGALARVGQVKEAIDLPFLRQDVEVLLQESVDGVRRVKKIVQDLREFSQVDSEGWQWMDVRRGLDSALNMLGGEFLGKAQVVKEYGEVPEIECQPSLLNQVFMNLLLNAAQAVEGGGTITIRAGALENEVWVEIADSGKGIPPENLDRIFEPFFTTQPVGKGTGLGLSLVYGIVRKHNGRINVASEPGKGTAFRVCLPLRQPAEEEAR
jgi:PAS domain S-box-containing protein